MSVNATRPIGGYEVYKNYQNDLKQPTGNRTYTHLGVCENKFYALKNESKLFEKIQFFVLWLLGNLRTDHQSIVACKRNLKALLRSELNSEIKSLTEQRDRLKAQVAELEPLEQKVKALNTDLKTKTKELDEVQEKQRSAHQDVYNQGLESSRLGSSIAQLRVQKDAIEKEIASFKETEVYQKIQATKAEMAQLKTEVESLQAKHKKEKNYETFEATLASKSAKIEKLKENRDKLVNRYKRMIHDIPSFEFKAEQRLQNYGIRFNGRKFIISG